MDFSPTAEVPLRSDFLLTEGASGSSLHGTMTLTRVLQVASFGTTLLIGSASFASTQCDGEKTADGKKKSFSASTQCDGEKTTDGKKKSFAG